MMRLTASIQKELILLFRDKTGLLLLFIMPAFLVLLITLVQENVLKANIKVLFIDHDRGEISQNIEKLLEDSDTIELVKEFKGAAVTVNDANRAVSEGTYQFCIILPEGITSAVKQKSFNHVKKNMLGTNSKTEVVIPEITLYFDPTIQGSYKIAINNILSRVVIGVEQKLKLKNFLDLLPEKIKTGIPEEFRPFFPETFDTTFLNDLEKNDSKTIIINEKSATQMGFVKPPTSVQQNIPAWSLFGIFFIVVPIAGSLINERDTGTMLRLKAMPVSYFTLMSGKIAAYTMVCFGQFGIILFIGKYILPLFNAPAFEAGQHYFTFSLILLSSIFAATGYGILLGTVMKTYEQASMFAPVSVVIAAAIGGIMIPLYAMPSFMQPLSILSPLCWGQNAFYDILLRGGGLQSALPEIIALLSFFIITLLLSCFFIFYREHPSI
ncbi:MAG: ABC transporter permease [Thermodesulfobacteriota bacterium]